VKLSFCTTDEVKRVKSGKKTDAHTGDTFNGDDNDDNVEDDDFEPDMDEETSDTRGEEPEKDEFLSVLREEFPEAWIFVTIEYGNVSIEKVYKVPDSITTWHISAFSLHEHTGLAVIKPQELIVRNDFCIKFSLPYSIRFKEILRIDVLIFNYLDDDKPLNVKLIIRNQDIKEFQFVEYGKNGELCEPTYNNMTQILQSVKVPRMEMRKLSYFIRVNLKEDNEETSSRIQALAVATDSKGKIHRDGVQKTLKVKPLGVKVQNVRSFDFVVENEIKTLKFENEVRNSNFTSYCIVNTDYLTGTINLKSQFV